MAKLWNILAASVGGGIALGVGIRVGESLAPRTLPEPLPETGSVADRLTALEWQSTKTPQPQQVASPVQDLVAELVDTRLAELETRLRAEAEERQQATLHAFVENVQSRVVSRIGALEASVSEQGDAIGELRDYSLQTERNIQRLLQGIEKLASHRLAAESPEGARPAAEQTAPSRNGATGASKRERWFQ